MDRARGRWLAGVGEGIRGARYVSAGSSAPRISRRVLVSLAIGLVSGAYWYYASWANPTGVSDFDQLWAGARALLDGANPYAVVRANAPGPVGPFEYNLYYPLPALLVVTPLALLPIVAARAAFCAISFGLLAFLLTRRAWYPLAGLASGAGLMTLTLAQWSGFTAAAVLAPALSVVAATKPNAHIAVFASYRQWRAVLVSAATGVIFFVIAFVVRPGWVGEWLGAINRDPNLRPIGFHPLGWLLLLALFRWRRQASRWILVACFLPGTPVVYNALPLFAYRWSFRTTLILALLSHAAMWPPLLVSGRAGGFAGYAAVSVPSLLLLLYLPAVVFLLREPNVEIDADRDADTPLVATASLPAAS
jgi:hypothetical protein